MLQNYKLAVKCLIYLTYSVCLAQQVHVPNAQRLADELMAKHPEMQTIGIHLTPPGWTRDLNIAGSKPGKVGKLSADLDIDVAKSRKPSLRMTPKGAFDMGLPLNDAAGRPVGMVVIVIRETFTSSQAVAMERAAAIRDEAQAKIPSMQALLDHAVLIPSKAAMIAQTPLPDSAAGFTHFELDAAHDRLYLYGDHGALVFNRNGDLIESVKNQSVAAPQDLWFDTQRNQIYYTGPEGLEVYVRQDGKFRLESKFPIMGSRTSFYDPGRSTLYVAHPKNAEDGAALIVYRVE